MTILVTGAPATSAPAGAAAPAAGAPVRITAMDHAWIGAALVGQLRRGRADVPAPAAPLLWVRRDRVPALEAAAAEVGHVVSLPIRGRTQPAGPPPGGRRPPSAPRRWPGPSSGPPPSCRTAPPPTPPEVHERDEHWVPAGKGRTAFADARDVAARVHSVRSQEGTACILTDPAALTDDVRRLTGRIARDLGASPATRHRLAAGHRGHSLSGWRNRRGPSARKRPAAVLFSELPAREPGPEVALKQGHSTLPPTRASPDNEPGIG